VRVLATRLAAFTPETAKTSRELKQFLYTKLYTAHDLSQDRARSMQRIGELFRFFLDFPDRLPEAYRAQAEQEPLHRVICDYIAGMTDNFFERVYAAQD
jgi:dGTPase